MPSGAVLTGQSGDRNQAIEMLVRKLRTITAISGPEEETIRTLALKIRAVGRDQDVIREGDRPHECCLLVEGLMCRHKSTPEGRRQIFSFHIAGDIPDLQSLHLKTMDHTLSTVSPSRLAFIPHEDVLRLLHQHPRLSDIFWRDTLIDAAIFREWMLGIGRRPALNRCAHLLCELIVRMRAMGLTLDHAAELPLTQSELADALGLSIVHVNRTLQDLRRRGLIELGGGKLIVTDWQGLKATGEFEPSYLHLNASAEATP